MGLREISVIVAVASCILVTECEETRRKVNLRIESPCEDMRESQEQATQDFWELWESRVYSVQSKEMCERTFKEGINTAFNELERCLPHKYKRSIGSFAFDIAKALGKVAVSDFVRGNTRPGVFDDESILNSLEQVVHKGSRMLFDNVEESKRERMQSIRSLSDAAEKHPRELVEVAGYMPKPAWADSLALTEIAAGTADLKAIAHYCSQGRLATAELGELLEDEELQKLSPEETRLEDLRVYPAKQELEFIYTIKEQERGFWVTYGYNIMYWVGGLLLFIALYLLICIAYGLVLLHRMERNDEENARASKFIRGGDEVSEKSI